MKVHDMSARFTAANALLRTNTTRAMDSALGQFNDLLRLSRRDELGVRDIIPHLLLQLGREQECYDFLKWWATIDDEDHYDGHYDWDDDTLPFLDIHGADPFEPIDIFCSGTLSLSHLVALTLLKLGLFLDIDAYHESEGPVFGFGYGYDEPDPTIDRPMGRLVRAKMRIMDVPDVHTMAEKLQSQYRRLSRVVHDANPYFWEALVAEESPPPPPFCTPGSEEEAHLVLHQCLHAWQETEDAILMIDAETSRFTNVCHGTTAADALSNAPSGGPRKDAETLQKTRGTGKVFPSRFEPPVKTFPAELFPPTPISRGQMIRFVCRNDSRKVLTYADGACTNNGQLEPSAGWAVVCGTPGNDDKSCIVSGRLEDKGPFGDDSVATSNRAELRAAIAVLRLCDWREQGYGSIVIATDSTYVVDGATGWAKGWVRKGWKTRTGGNVKNKDLWDLLLGEVERWHHQGLRVHIWKIPRELNGDADAAAKQAARNGAAKVEFEDIVLGSSQTTTAETEPGSRILALCLEYESLFDACFGSLVSHITSKAKMERATTPEAALTILDQDSPPSIILVIDGGLTRQRKVWERVIDCLREGATVVLAGCFSSMVNEGEFNRFFAKLGLPWKRGSYHRATVTLRRGAVGDHLASRLPASYSQKALFVQNMERSAAWYTEKGTFDEAAVAIAQVGAGKLGYIGDVNGEEGSDKVVLAMCGLLD